MYSLQNTETQVFVSSLRYLRFLYSKRKLIRFHNTPLLNAHACFDSSKYSIILGYNALHKLVLTQYFLITCKINTQVILFTNKSDKLK